MSCGLSHIVADFRQIMWRKFLRNLCQYSAMTQKVLPHNVAWPFSPLLPSWCCPLSAAILCGRKSPMAPKVAPMLKQRILTDNVAPQIFFSGLTRKPVAKKSLGGLAILCVRNGRCVPGKPCHLCVCLLGDFHMLHTPNTQKSCLLGWNIVRTSLKCVAPHYEAPIRHESCQTTTRLDRPKITALSPCDRLRFHNSKFEISAEAPATSSE